MFDNVVRKVAELLKRVLVLPKTEHLMPDDTVPKEGNLPQSIRFDSEYLLAQLMKSPLKMNGDVFEQQLHDVGDPTCTEAWCGCLTVYCQEEGRVEYDNVLAKIKNVIVSISAMEGQIYSICPREQFYDCYLRTIDIHNDQVRFIYYGMTCNWDLRASFSSNPNGEWFLDVVN